MKTKIFLAALAILGMSMTANAISLRYKFKVFSSGPNIYACNAGILAQASTKKVCYFQGTNQSCTPDDCSTTGAKCDSSCLCSSTGGGDYLMNYGKVTYQDWKDNGDTSVTGQVKDASFRATSAGSWSQALTDSASWNERITDLSFNLGSELYSASYFVDICYRGPQIEYFEDNVASNFSLKAQSFATDFLSTGPNGGENNRDGLVIPGTVDGKKYTELSGLTVQAFVTCDFQGVGNFKLARNNSNAYNTADNEAGFSFGANKLPNGATEGSGSFWSSSVKSVNASVADLLNPWIVSNSSKAPRFCKIRYVFTESDYLATLPNLRKWQRHGAEMCTYTEINEDAVSETLN
jgi:hypothetical protein